MCVCGLCILQVDKCKSRFSSRYAYNHFIGQRPHQMGLVSYPTATEIGLFVEKGYQCLPYSSLLTKASLFYSKGFLYSGAFLCHIPQTMKTSVSDIQRPKFVPFLSTPRLIPKCYVSQRLPDMRVLFFYSIIRKKKQQKNNLKIQHTFFFFEKKEKEKILM